VEPTDPDVLREFLGNGRRLASFMSIVEKLESTSSFHFGTQPPYPGRKVLDGRGVVRALENPSYVVVYMSFAFSL